MCLGQKKLKPSLTEITEICEKIGKENEINYKILKIFYFINWTKCTMLVVDTKSNLYLLRKCQIFEELDHNINSEQSMCQEKRLRGYLKE